ncbi:MAG: hypothetical protein KTR32_43865 [Granulosicoccus sp.]|nr:hypothetical protein [Granulosicoccus sp.]
MKLFTLSALAVSALILSGCMPTASDTPGSGTAEGYQYKGKADPLMAESASDRAATLSERFKLIQARQ